MTLPYTCFISYRHMASPEATAIIDEFCRRLGMQIELIYGGASSIYYDKARLRGGDYFTPALAKALCESSCMIMLYMPGYFAEDHSFCAREYKAMLRLEDDRRTAIGEALGDKSLIIPVVLRGADSLPEDVKKREYILLERESTTVSRLRGERTADKFRDLARLIYERHEIQRAGTESLRRPCAEFAFPELADIQPWLRDTIAQRRPAALPFGSRP